MFLRRDEWTEDRMDLSVTLSWPCFPCSYQQIQVLEKMTVERMSAERSECVQRGEQRARKERLETERRQVRAGRTHLAGIRASGEFRHYTRSFFRKSVYELCERFFREMYQNQSGFKLFPSPLRPQEGQAVLHCQDVPTMSKCAVVCVCSVSRRP